MEFLSKRMELVAITVNEVIQIPKDKCMFHLILLGISSKILHMCVSFKPSLVVKQVVSCHGEEYSRRREKEHKGLKEKGK